MEWPSIAELVEQTTSGEQSIIELVQKCLDRIEQTNAYNAIIEVNPQVLKRARELENSAPTGKLYGVPFVAKDVFLTNNTHTTASSNMLRLFKSSFQATAIEKLEAEGAIMLGKANHDAFGHGSSTENSDFGVTKNPHDPAYGPGGSSGGSAASVALGQAAFSLAEDTGGSIRLPANYCGVVGLKVTYGLVSRYGVISMASSHDTIGPICRSVEDAAYVLDIIAGKDPMDATTIKRDPSSYRLDGSYDMKGVKVGLIKEHRSSSVDDSLKQNIDDVVEKLEKAGAEIVEVSIPIDELGLSAYYIIVPAEISSNLSRFDGIKYGYSSADAKNLEQVYELSRAQGFNSENKRRIMIGTYVLSSGYYDAYYKKAQQVRTLLAKQYAETFKSVDVIIDQVAPTPPFKLGSKQDPLAMYLTDVFTVQTNLLGIPSVAVPTGTFGKLPLGVQVMGPQQSEKQILEVAAVVEQQAKEQ